MKYKSINIEGLSKIGVTTQCITLNKALLDLKLNIEINDNLGFCLKLANLMINGYSLKDLEFDQTIEMRHFEEKDCLHLILLADNEEWPKRMTYNDTNKEIQTYLSLIPAVLFNRKLNFAMLKVSEGEKIMEINKKIVDLLKT